VPHQGSQISEARRRDPLRTGNNEDEVEVGIKGPVLAENHPSLDALTQRQGRRPLSSKKGRVERKSAVDRQQQG